MVLQHPHVRNILNFYVVRKCQQSITAVTCSLCCPYTEKAQYLCCACPSLTQHERVSRWSLTEESKVQIFVRLGGICSCPSVTGTRFLPNTKVYPLSVQYFSPSTSVSPVSIIPAMLHTHSFIYPRSRIIFFSQYFSFPLSVSFHQFSKLIHLSLTLIILATGR